MSKLAIAQKPPVFLNKKETVGSVAGFIGEADCWKVGSAKRALEVAGHYSHPDIFTLHLNTKLQSPVDFERHRQ
jgi:hypothetical protein